MHYYKSNGYYFIMKIKYKYKPMRILSIDNQNNYVQLIFSLSPTKYFENKNAINR